MPHTVPNRPMNGAVEPMVARKVMPPSSCCCSCARRLRSARVRYSSRLQLWPSELVLCWRYWRSAPRPSWVRRATGASLCCSAVSTSVHDAAAHSVASEARLSRRTCHARQPRRAMKYQVRIDIAIRIRNTDTRMASPCWKVSIRFMV
ncbi:hypothetical protein D3C78_1547060 [compost metagenome]